MDILSGGIRNSVVGCPEIIAPAAEIPAACQEFPVIGVNPDHIRAGLIIHDLFADLFCTDDVQTLDLAVLTQMGDGITGCAHIYQRIIVLDKDFIHSHRVVHIGEQHRGFVLTALFHQVRKTDIDIYIFQKSAALLSKEGTVFGVLCINERNVLQYRIALARHAKGTAKQAPAVPVLIRCGKVIDSVSPAIKGAVEGLRCIGGIGAGAGHIIAQNKVACGIGGMILGELLQLAFGINDKGGHHTFGGVLRLFRKNRKLYFLADFREHFRIQYQLSILDFL